MRPIFIPEPQILSKIYYKFKLFFKIYLALKQISEIFVTD